MQPHDEQQNNFKKYRFASFVLDPQDTTPFRLLKDGQPCKIQRKQFELLVCLVERHGQLISYDELFKDLWNHKPDSDPIVLESRVGKLQKQVNLLRKVIGKDMISSQKGFYCFVEPVIEEPSRGEDVDAFKDLTFQWIVNAHETRSFERFFGGFILISILYLFASWAGVEIPYLSFRAEPRLVLSVIQFIVIAYAFLGSLFIFKQQERVFPQSAAKDHELMKASGYTDEYEWFMAKQSAKDSLGRYLFYWRLLIATWTLLYVILIARYAGLSDYPVMKIVSTVFDISNSLAIALCFVVLNQPTIFGTDGSARNLTRMTRRLEIYGVLTIVLFAVIQGGVLLLESSGRLLPHVRVDIFEAVDVVTGLIGAVVIALLVGRIQSKFLGPSTWLPTVLYSYVALPSLYAYFSNRSILIGETLILEAVLILKCLLFLFVMWLFKSGRFLFYFVRAKKIYKTVNPDWKDFFLNLDRRVKS